MSILLPIRLFAIIFRTEHKATYLHMTLDAPKRIQLNIQENKARWGLVLVYTYNLKKEFRTILLKFHIDKTYNGKNSMFITQTFSLLRKAEQISYF